MSTSTICILVAIVVYMVGIIWIGFACAKKNKNTEDFYLGGRKLGPFVTAMSAEASDMSSWLLMGLPGVAYLTGVADAAWTAIGLAIGTYVNWLIVAKRLRIYTHMSSNSSTIPAFFSNRYRDNKRILSVISAIVIVIFFVPYTASGFAACGKLFNSLFGIDYFTAMIISALVIVVYTALGGFLAASTSDFVQSIIMTIAIFVVISYGIISVGGIDKVMDNATSMAGYLSLFKSHNAETGAAVSYNALTVFSTLAWGLGYFGMPHVIVRFMSIEKPDMINKSATVAIIWVVLALGAACVLAYLARMIVGEELLTTGTQKMVFIVMSRKFFPPAIAGLLLAAIMAASVSTADSQLLVASSSFTSDIYQPIFRKDAGEKEVLNVGRAAVVIIAVIAYIIASSKGSGAQAIMNLVENAWGIFGASFGPVVILSLFWRRFNYTGACVGVIVGAAADILWLICFSGSGIYELLPGFIAGCLAAVIATLITPAPSKTVTDIFDKAAASDYAE